MFSAADGTMVSFIWYVLAVWYNVVIYMVCLSCLRVDMIADGGWMCQGVTTNCNY
jgi:hypothetical protein